MKKLSILKIFMATLLLGTMAACNNGEAETDPADAEKEVNHLIIKEVFSTGSWHPRWQQLYPYDSYIIIHNPTDQTFYLDSMAIAQTGLSCDKQRNLREGTDHRDNFFGAGIVVMFGGSGKDHPIAPHSDVVLAARAIDHTKNMDEEEGLWNPGSVDLSHAHFQWLTNTMIEREDFVPSETVPNMETIYPVDMDMLFDLVPQSGALALVQIRGKVHDLMNDPAYKWSTNWSEADKDDDTGIIDEGGGHAHDHEYDPVVFLKIPNEWVIDCVQLCPQLDMQWEVVGAALDNGYTSVLTTYMDKHINPQNIAGKALVREFDGKKFVDNDNSSFDFKVKPASLIRQATP